MFTASGWTWWESRTAGVAEPMKCHSVPLTAEMRAAHTGGHADSRGRLLTAVASYCLRGSRLAAHCARGKFPFYFWKLTGFLTWSWQKAHPATMEVRPLKPTFIDRTLSQGSIRVHSLNRLPLPPSAAADMTYVVKVTLVCAFVPQQWVYRASVWVACWRPPVCNSLVGLYGVCLEVCYDPDVSGLLRRMNRELVEHHDSPTWNLLRAPCEHPPQSWHLYLEHIYRLPIYSVAYDIVMKPAGLTKLSPCIGCVCSICTHVKWSVRSCSTACLFNSPIRQIRLVCTLISQKALMKNKWITMRVKQSWKLSAFKKNNHMHVHMVDSHRIQIWPAECVYLNF